MSTEFDVFAFNLYDANANKKEHGRYFIACFVCNRNIYRKINIYH